MKKTVKQIRRYVKQWIAKREKQGDAVLSEDSSEGVYCLLSTEEPLLLFEFNFTNARPWIDQKEEAEALVRNTKANTKLK